MSNKIKLKKKPAPTPVPKLKNIKPCPFCGNDSLKIVTIIGRMDQAIGSRVVCEPKSFPCGSEGPIKDTRIGAKRAWNKRK